MALAEAMDPRYRAAGPARRLRRVARSRTLWAPGQTSGSSAANGGHRRDGRRPRWPSVLRTPQDQAGRRNVPLPRVVADPLAEHLRTLGRQPDDLVFTAPEDGPVQLNVWRWRFWALAVRKAGLEHLRPHDLRHTAVALWMAAGANPKEVAARAGHTSVSFTLDRYGHLLAGSEQRLNDAIDALAEGAPATAEVTDDTHDSARAREKRFRSRT
jgi:integrase